MKNIAIIFVMLFAGFVLNAQDKKAYQIFDRNGNAVMYSDMLKSTTSAQVVLFGELHNNALCHWLEFELAKDLYAAKGEKLIMGAEMLETDGQLLLDEYLQDLMAEKNYKEQARLWQNYATDYAPLVNFAKEKKLRFIATNIPRHYASMVAKGGFEALNSLSDPAKALICPLPVPYDENLDCYKSMLSMGGGMGKQGNPNLPKAQAVKDATMTHFILKNMKPGDVFLHFNGSYHSDNGESMVWYLKKSGQRLNIVTISTVEQTDVSTLSEEYKNRADFILVVDEDLTKTY
ncbi:MAG TPA: ChaN family lipoprotein [Bacteroidales bacterium]|nr:ChaN family lipoprotein [Bacteroidales bacterium]